MCHIIVGTVLYQKKDSTSTVLGLIPFLTDGPEEVFWFDFAVGTIGGMLFSVIALILVLPVFLLSPETHH